MRNTIIYWSVIFYLFSYVPLNAQDFAIRDAEIVYHNLCKSPNEKCKGSITWSDGSSFKGTLKNGIPNGWGVYTLANKTSHNGSFVDGLAHGNGQRTYPNGESYSGEWKLGQINGKGVYTWKNGCKFHGLFKNGRMGGFGILQLPNGKSFRGNWVNHLGKIAEKYRVKNQEKERKVEYGLFMPQGHVFMGTSKSSINFKEYIAFQHIDGKNRIFLWHKKMMSSMPDQVFFNDQLFTGDEAELQAVVEGNQKLTPGMINLWYSIGQFHISKKNMAQARENLGFSLQFAKTGTKIHSIIKEQMDKVTDLTK